MSSIQAAKLELMFSQPFFASLLCKHNIKERSDIPTLAVDVHGNIMYNPKFIEKLSKQELIFCLAHEVMHIVCMHAYRKGNRDHHLWNVAGDLYINSFLDSSKVGSRPDGCLFEYGSESKTTEQIYDELLKEREEMKKSMQGGGDGDSDGEGSSGGDSQSSDSDGDSGSGHGMTEEEMNDPLAHDVQEGSFTQAEAEEAEIQNKLDVASAAQAARLRGNASGALARLIKDILEVKTPWHEILSRYFSGLQQQQISWDRPNRRFTDMYLPSTDAEPTLGTVVLGIDTSGSISNSMLQYFASHLNSILDTCKPEKVYVVYCDSAVDHVDEFTAEDLPVHLEMHGGGGTDMREVVAWAEENVDDPSVCIIFTDMYTPFPDSEPAFPLLWASVTEGYKSPVGETIYVDSSAD